MSPSRTAAVRGIVLGVRPAGAATGARVAWPARWPDGRAPRGDPRLEESPSTTTQGSG